MSTPIEINAYGECARCKGPVIEQGGVIVDRSPVEVIEGPRYGLVGFIHWPMPAGLRLVVGGREVEAAPGMTGHRPHEDTCCVPFRDAE